MWIPFGNDGTMYAISNIGYYCIITVNNEFELSWFNYENHSEDTVIFKSDSLKECKDYAEQDEIMRKLSCYE